MKSSIITKIRNYFLAGIVTLIPILITVYLTVVVIDLFSKIVPDAVNPNKYLFFKDSSGCCKSKQISSF